VWSEAPLRYERLTWPEVRRAAAGDRVALIPVATLEDHGPHLPVDTDLRIVGEICERAAARARQWVVVGEMVRCDWSEQRPEWPRTKSLEQVLEEHLEPLGVPVLYRLPLGHGKHLATLPLGVTATLDADARTLTIDEPALREPGRDRLRRA
jgi:Creatinine amidohydrolase/LD-carboxypeptidase C-terminal domain